MAALPFFGLIKLILSWIRFNPDKFTEKYNYFCMEGGPIRAFISEGISKIFQLRGYFGYS